jgi:hypothetical protein
MLKRVRLGHLGEARGVPANALEECESFGVEVGAHANRIRLGFEVAQHHVQKSVRLARKLANVMGESSIGAAAFLHFWARMISSPIRG